MNSPLEPEHRALADAKLARWGPVHGQLTLTDLEGHEPDSLLSGDDTTQPVDTTPTHRVA